jgi:hypothetical protein
MNFPARFYTGIRNTTIPNPAVLYSGARTFQGLCSDYDFERQTDNFNALRQVLLANGTDFLYVAAAHYKGDLHTNHRFVACSADGRLMWNKYVAHVAQGGQNHVFVNGMRIKVSVFLRRTPVEQTALLTGRNVNQIFDAGLLGYLDEAGELWN